MSNLKRYTKPKESSSPLKENSKVLSKEERVNQLKENYLKFKKSKQTQKIDKQEEKDKVKITESQIKEYRNTYKVARNILKYIKPDSIPLLLFLLLDNFSLQQANNESYEDDNEAIEYYESAYKSFISSFSKLAEKEELTEQDIILEFIK